MPKEKIISRFIADGEKTAAFFEGLSGEIWSYKVYSDGDSWTIHQILKHLVSAEAAIMRLVQNILAGGGGVPEDFDLDRYNESKVRKIGDRSPEELLADFSAARSETVKMVERMTDADLEKTGRHPFLGIAPVEDILKLMYRHAQIHQRDIRRQIKEMDP
jgi:hypothetical protein